PAPLSGNGRHAVLPVRSTVHTGNHSTVRGRKPEGKMDARKAVGLLVLVVAASGSAARSADHAPLPFVVGERLSYRVDASGIGGRGTVSVDGPVDVRGTETYHLRFDVEAGFGPVKGKNRTESWLDPVRMAALRFHASERRLLSKRDERV